VCVCVQVCDAQAPHGKVHLVGVCVCVLAPHCDVHVCVSVCVCLCVCMCVCVCVRVCE